MTSKRLPIVGTFLTDGPVRGPWGIHLSDKAWKSLGKKVRPHAMHNPPRMIHTTLEEAITKCVRRFADGTEVATTLAGAFGIR